MRENDLFSPSIRNKLTSNLAAGGTSQQVSTWTTDHFQSYSEEGHMTEHFAPSAKISPRFSSISAMCIWQPMAGRRQPHQGGHSPRRDALRDASSFHVRGAGFPWHLQGLLLGLKSVLLLWSGKARDFSSSWLLLARPAAGRGSPRVKWGWHRSLALQFTLFWMNS